jgi:hypothetical protein
MMAMFDHIFNGVPHKVVNDSEMIGVSLRGVANSIVLWQDPRKEQALQVAVHEALHAEFKDLPEAVVEIAGRDIGGYLWKLGYRMRPAPKPRKKRRKE